MELEGTIGRRVKILLEDGTNIDGFVHSFSAYSGKLSLEKVQCIENGRKKKLVGLQHYFAEEIDSIIVTEDVCKNQKKKKAQESYGNGRGGMLKAKMENSHLNRLQFVDQSSLILKNKKLDDTLTSSGNESGTSDSDYINALPESDEYTILPKLCNTFYDAINYIRKFQVIGIAMEGISIGRFGKLCWLQVAVPGHVFMFDVLQMGKACFDEGMKGIFENENILKVLHDCRLVSDILHHQYSINMINVFDTQVANAFVSRLKHNGVWPRHVDGLASVLVHHLDISMDEVNWAVVRERRREEDEQVWLERPPQQHLVSAAVKNAKHLLDLRLVLMDRMMEEYAAGVNIYLMQVRDASDKDSQRHQRSPHLLPVAFQNIHSFMASSRYRNPHLKVYEVKKDMNGFHENVTSIAQPDVYFSKDSIWHGGSKMTDKKDSVSASGTAKNLSPNSLPADKNLVQISQENRSDQSPKQNTSSSHRNNDLGSKVALPTDRHAGAHVDSDDISVQSGQSTIPSRRNLYTSPNNDLISETVAGMNARKLQMEDRLSESEFYESRLNALNSRSAEIIQETSADSLDVSVAGELKGGILMRALIHEQDASGYEALNDIENFKIMPAGKNVSVNKKAKVKSNNSLNSVTKWQENSSPDSSYYSNSNRQGVNQLNGNVSPNRVQKLVTNTCETLRPAIPGGDIATTSPPRRSVLSERELFLLKSLQKVNESLSYGESSSNIRLSQSVSDDDIPVNKLSSQGASGSNHREQLQGKSSIQDHSPNSKSSIPSPSSMKDLHSKSQAYDSGRGYKSEDNETLRSQISPSSSQPNPKLLSLFQKLKQQQQQTLS